MAIKEALSWLKCNVLSVRDITILTDSQAAIKSLESCSFTSKAALNCRLSLMEMTEQFNIHLCWVPGHRDIPGNCRADELARQGTTLRILSDRQSLGMPLATCKHLLKLNAISKTNLRWENVSTCLISRQIWPRLDHKRSAELVKLKRSQISCVVGVLTGHCLIGQHAKRLGLFSNDFCRSCRDEEEEESIPHLLCNCPALSHKRMVHLGSPFLEVLGDIASLDVMRIYRFIKSSGWFC